jgi:hypothetical protein
MSATHMFFLGIFLTALIGLIGWFLNKLVNIVSETVLKLDVTIAKFDQKFENQQLLCGIHRKTLEDQHIEVKDEIERVDDKIDKVEKKIDKHIENHPVLKRRAS